MLEYNDLTRVINGRYFKGSCTYSEKNELQKILSGINPVPKTIVELGTFNGLSALVMAGICDVHTFDVHYFKEAKEIWNQFKTRGKITSYVVKNCHEIGQILKSINFDFAFVDVVHEKEPTREAFELVKDCGRVLFHDNFERFPGVMELCNEIGAKRIEYYFGYWEGKRDYKKNTI